MKRDLLRPQVLRLRAEGAPLRMTSGGDIRVRAESVPGGSPFLPPESEPKAALRIVEKHPLRILALLVTHSRENS